MRAALTALNDELRRLKSGGQGLVSVTEESLALLHAAADASIAAASAASIRPPGISLGTKTAFADSAPIPPPPAPVILPEGTRELRWQALRERVMADPVCQAHVRPGKKVVLGVGSLEASIFFCGEAPGADEEMVGEPFVGPAGQLLTKMISGMGLGRGDVYIGNIMNWRPEMAVVPGGVQVGNRPPTAQELAYCLPYLRAQLEIVQPKVIVALGKTAAAGLLGAGTFRTLEEIRSRWHDFNGVPVMVTFHPSYILRNNSQRSKRAIWEDLLQVMERTGLAVTDRQRGFFS